MTTDTPTLIHSTPKVHLARQTAAPHSSRHLLEAEVLAAALECAVIRLDRRGVVTGILGEAGRRVPFLPYLGKGIAQLTQSKLDLDTLRKRRGQLVDVTLDGPLGSGHYRLSIFEVSKNDGEIEFFALPQKIDTAARLDIEETDSLTGLGNMKAYFREAKALFSASTGECCVLLLDLDRFQNVNEAFGHATSDIVLHEIGRRVAATVDGGGKSFRHGGDAFIAITRGGRDEGLAQARKLMVEVNRPMKIDGLEMQICCSIGVAIYPSHGKDAVEVLDAAEVAMMRGKNNGRHLVEVFDPASREVAREHIQIQAALNDAVIRNELSVVYQPKVRLSNGEFAGVEALLRLGSDLFTPAKFIPVAEESGIIDVLGEWIMLRACEMATFVNKKRAHCPVAVNVSARQFMRGDFENMVRRVIERTGVDPKHLEIEITESAIIMDPMKAANVIERIRALGVRVAVDDFGIGFSSLSYLKKFRIDTIKIDKSFIAELPDDPKSEAIVRAIVEMGHALNVDIVAEGVERRECLPILREIGCDMAQGYYVSKPLTEREIHDWIEGYLSLKTAAA